MRGGFIAMLTIGAMAVPVPASALEASASRSTAYLDAKDDVRIVSMDESDPVRTGEGNGDIRRVVTRVDPERVRVSVTFDAPDAARRLTLTLSFAARTVSGGLGYIAQLEGSFATGRPEQSFSSFFEGAFETTDAPCPGLVTRANPRRWTFSVPTSCLGQARRVKYQEVNVRTAYFYEDAFGYDKWPQRGSRKIR